MTPELHAPYCGKLRNGYLKEKFLDSPKKIVIGSKSELGHREWELYVLYFFIDSYFILQP